MNRIREKLSNIEISKYVGKVVLGHFLIVIKFDSGKFFLNIGKKLILTIKNKNVTYPNPSLKLWINRKYGIELTPMKSYKRRSVFLKQGQSKI